MSSFPELPHVICLLDIKREGGGRKMRKVWQGEGGREGKNKREKQFADVKEDHTLQDNITRDLNHPLPLIY